MHRTIWRLLFTYIFIAVLIYACEFISMWFYPMALVLLSHQYYSLALIAHEGVHGLLYKNPFWNEQITRYFCHAPLFVSYNHYTLTHLKHHRYLGTPNDPDIILYQKSYRSRFHWIRSNTKNIINLNLALSYISYFSGCIDFLLGKYPYKIKSDLPILLPMWTLSLTLLTISSLFDEFIMYWALPILTLLPWFLLSNSYQHFVEDGPRPGYANTIFIKNRWLKEFLFPLNINYHEAHHQHPDIPYYLLPEYHQDSSNTYSLAVFSKKILNSQTSKSY